MWRAVWGLGLANPGDCRLAAASHNTRRLVKSGRPQLAAASNSSIKPVCAGLLSKVLQAWLGSTLETVLWVTAGNGESSATATTGLHRGSTFLARVGVKEIELGTLPMPCTR